MNAEIRLAVLCDHALVGQDGKLSVMGIFRNITVTDLPAHHPRMYLVAVLGLDAGKHEVVVRLVRPDGGEGLGQAPKIAVTAVAGQDVNVLVELNNVQFQSYGAHRFDLVVDGTAVGSLGVGVSRMTAQPGRKN